MEGSVAAGQAGGDAGDAQGQGQAQQGGGDVGQLMQQLESLSGGVGELQDFLKSEPWRQQEAVSDQGQQDDGLDLSFLDDGTGIGPDPQQVAQQFRAAMEKAAAAQVAPLQQTVTAQQEAMAEMRREREAEHLVGEFPEMGTDEVATQVVGLARQMAEQLGRPELANEPKFWRIAYMAGRAADSANQEGADAPGAAHLEGGSGATPGSNSQVDLGDSIVNAGPRVRLPFG